MNFKTYNIERFYFKIYLMLTNVYYPVNDLRNVMVWQIEDAQYYDRPNLFINENCISI